MNKQLPYIVTGMAVIGLMFLVSVVYFMKSALLFDVFETDNGYTSETVSESNGFFQPLPDPLITVVPDEQRSVENKSKVFVSSADPLLGANTAKVFVILFGNFNDTTSIDYVAMFNTLSEQYSSEDVAFVWKDYIISDDERAQRMAEIGHCADEVGRFWDYAAVVRDRTADDDEALLAIADSAGVNKIVAQDCLDTAGYAGQINQSYYYAQSLNIANTHTMFVNDRVYTEPMTQEQLTSAINEVLATY